MDILLLIESLIVVLGIAFWVFIVIFLINLFTLVRKLNKRLNDCEDCPYKNINVYVHEER